MPQTDLQDWGLVSVTFCRCTSCWLKTAFELSYFVQNQGSLNPKSKPPCYWFIQYYHMQLQYTIENRYRKVAELLWLERYVFSNGLASQIECIPTLCSVCTAHLYHVGKSLLAIHSSFFPCPEWLGVPLSPSSFFSCSVLIQTLHVHWWDRLDQGGERIEGRRE